MKIGLWKLRKEERETSIVRIINIITQEKDTHKPSKPKTPRVYTKVTDDHNELLQSLLKKVLIQLPPINQKATKIIGGFCQYHRVHGHKTCECKKFRDIIQDLVDRKAISFEKPKVKGKAPMHADNEKLGIYKKPMPKHNTRIMYAQGNAKKSLLSLVH